MRTCKTYLSPTAPGIRLAAAISLLALIPALALAQSEPPRLFFSDLDSGPSSGGENNNGVYVTLYGNNLGSNPTVTVGGGSALVKAAPSPWLWFQKMTIQLGSQAQTGTIVVSNGNGASNGIPFSVRSGQIYFVSTSGNDVNSGSFSSPWATLPHAVQSSLAGDTIYVLDGVSQTVDDGQGWDAALTLRPAWCQGTSTNPKALVAYPGATVTIGSSGSSPGSGIRSVDFTASGGACGGHWTISGINLRGSTPLSMAGPSSTWRIIGNDISNPQAGGGGGGGAALVTELATYVKVLGNHGHDLNLASTDRLQQGFYLSTDSNHSELGWNVVENVKGRTGIQVHSSPVSSGNGYVMYDILIHDNMVHDIAEEGIAVDTVDPSKGPVEIFNNVVYNVGQDGNSNGAIYRAVSSDFDTSQGIGTGTVEIYNNTIFGYLAGYAFGATYEIHRDQAIVNRLRNNILFSSTGNPYIYQQNDSSTAYGMCGNNDTPTQCPLLTGSNNLMYGAGIPVFPNLLVSSINQDPKLLSSSDGHLQAGSPAIDSGTSISALPMDLDGTPRPQGAAFDVGAYEFGNGTPSITISVNPAAVSLSQGQSQQFTSSVTGTVNTGVTWSMSPSVGQLSATGQYFAPSVITASQSVAITATSTFDATKSAKAIVTLLPPLSVSITVTPSTISLGAGASVQLAATVVGTGQTAVSWSMSPSVGTLTSGGLYTAPQTITSTQTVTIKATSVADPTKSASATVTLLGTTVLTSPYAVQYSSPTATSLQVKWTAPSSITGNMTLTSPGAPDWWYLSITPVSGSTGIFTVPRPTATGLYEFRLYVGGVLKAKSSTLSQNVSGFTLKPSSTTVSAGSTMTLLFTAPAGRPGGWSGDRIDLSLAGTAVDQAVWWGYPLGKTSGTLTVAVPKTPGTYQFWYELAGSGYISAAQSILITVK